jgi:hypothetical protein
MNTTRGAGLVGAATARDAVTERATPAIRATRSSNEATNKVALALEGCVCPDDRSPASDGSSNLEAKGAVLATAA